MATLTITLPDAMVPDLLLMADALLTQKSISTAGMTATQKGQRYVAERMKDDYLNYKRQQAQAAADATIATAAQGVINAMLTAKTAADTITG